jgi:nitroimidazol reductase NimA-like FMN-containing flavoprotein (pyridoxamine 5'-phosphate oxidase superfamily)
MSKSKGEMSQTEIDQFLTCSPTGRLGLIIDNEPYIVPVGYVYHEGKIAIHSCIKGKKMQALKSNPRVCFEVDETVSDVSMYKSVIMFGRSEILDEPEAMIPYLQLHINKYRVPEAFETYMQKPGRKRVEETKAVRIILITPDQVTGRKFMRTIEA